MSEELLKGLLLGEIDVDLITNWLKSDQVDSNFKCEKQEFVIKFIDYLRDSTARYVQTVPVVFKKEIPNLGKVFSTSTPKRRVNRSLPAIDTSFDSKNKKNRSFNATCPTLENFITDSFFNSTKENISSNKKEKKKKRGRNSNSPSKDSIGKISNSCDFGQNHETSFDAQNHSYDSKFRSFESKFNNSPNRTPHIDSPIHNSPIRDSRERKAGETKGDPNVLKARRIKPTILNENIEKTVIGSNSFTFANQNSELDTFQWQRSILKEEKDKIASRTSDSIITVRKNPTNSKKTNVSLSLVTKIPTLLSLVKLYKVLIDFGYCLNPLTEFTFVLTLLLANGSEGSFFSPLDDVFESIHNCVFFAAHLLLEEVEFLERLNRSTLRLLCENGRLNEFVPQLSKVLGGMVVLRPAEVTIGPVQNEDLHIATYIPETDGRDYFPNDASFHAFRRQRDIFYDILRTWQLSKGRPGFNFQSALSIKIRSLLSAHQHPINYHHVSKLIVRQILASNSYNEELDNSGSLDKDLPNVSSEKLNKLKNRLTTRETETEIQFPHKQEFYREFITCCAFINSMFMAHLIDALSDTILTMEDGFDNEQPDSPEITFSDSNYLHFLKSTRLLAKFLGYIIALPYKTELRDTTLKTLMTTRRHSLPPIDLESRLNSSVASNSRILITLPWLVEYLINLDSVTLKLPSYLKIIKVLLAVNVAIRGKVTSAAFFLRLVLGRLFQSECFPRNLFYEGVEAEVKLERDMTEDVEVAEEAFYECVPSLGQLKKILSSGQTSVCVRSIRPVTTSTIPIQKVQGERDQKQLEEVFFHGQSESVRRSVNFVSERISSAIVKNLKRILIEDSITHATESFIKYLDDRQELKNDQYEIYIKEAMQRAKEISERSLVELKSKCREYAEKMTRVKSEKAIPSLLPDDMHPQAIQLCITVASNKATDRINNWIEQSLNVAQIMDPLTKELGKMDDESKNKNNVYITQYEKLQQHSVVKLLSDNKQLIISIHESPSQITKIEIENILGYNKNTILGRNDINGALKDTIKAQIIDISLALIVNRPDLSKDFLPLVIETLEILFNVNDKKDKSAKDRSINLLNARNIQFIEEGSNVKDSWLVFTTLLTILLKKKIISSNAFEEQVLKIFQNNFSEETFDSISKNLRLVVAESGLGNTELLKVTSCLTAFLVDEI